MPHFKCAGCRTRLYSSAAPADPVGDLCPGCGSLLEPVSDLAEIVGFQSIKRRDRATDDRSQVSPDLEGLAAAIARPRPNENP